MFVGLYNLFIPLKKSIKLKLSFVLKKYNKVFDIGKTIFIQIIYFLYIA